MKALFMFFLSLISLFATAIVEADSQLTLINDAKSLSEHITTVKICGSWNYNGKQGKYRIITGWLYGHSEIYIQWLADTDNKKDLEENSKVMFTLSLPSTLTI